MRDSRTVILDAAVDILRDPSGPNLTLDSAARASGLTRPGLMYHFPTKAALVHGVVEHVIRRWVDRLHAALGRQHDEASSYERITAYVHTVTSADLDLADLSVFFDAHYRSELTAVWVELMEPWLTVGDDVPPEDRGRLTAARLAADGYWFAAAGGFLTSGDERIADAILELIDTP